MQPDAMAGAPKGCYPPLMSGVAGSHGLPFTFANRRTDPVIAKSDSGVPAARKRQWSGGCGKAHRVIKVWWALWKKMRAMKLPWARPSVARLHELSAGPSAGAWQLSRSAHDGQRAPRPSGSDVLWIAL